MNARIVLSSFWIQYVASQSLLATQLSIRDQSLQIAFDSVIVA